MARGRRFDDGEFFLEILETVRGREVFVIQSTSTPVNENIMELLIMVDALRRASAGSITAVIPYYGYARQDKKELPRSPITAKLVADLLAVAGCHRVTSVDFHAGQVQGFFDIPVDHLFAAPVFIRHIREHFSASSVVVSPDAGGVERARFIAERLKMQLAVTDSRRESPESDHGVSIIGEVEGRVAILVDDMVDTARTLCNAARGLAEQGAEAVYAYSTHSVLSGEAVERIMASPIRRLVVTNTIPPSKKARECSKIQVLSLAQLLGEAIRRTHNKDSVSSLFV